LFVLIKYWYRFSSPLPERISSKLINSKFLFFFKNSINFNSSLFIIGNFKCPPSVSITSSFLVINATPNPVPGPTINFLLEFCFLIIFISLIPSFLSLNIEWANA